MTRNTIQPRPIWACETGIFAAAVAAGQSRVGNDPTVLTVAYTFQDDFTICTVTRITKDPATGRIDFTLATGTTKCSPHDTPDDFLGGMLAFQRAITKTA